MGAGMSQTMGAGRALPEEPAARKLRQAPERRQCWRLAAAGRRLDVAAAQHWAALDRRRQPRQGRPSSLQLQRQQRVRVRLLWGSKSGPLPPPVAAASRGSSSRSWSGARRAGWSTHSGGTGPSGAAPAMGLVTARALGSPGSAEDEAGACRVQDVALGSCTCIPLACPHPGEQRSLSALQPPWPGQHAGAVPRASSSGKAACPISPCSPLPFSVPPEATNYVLSLLRSGLVAPDDIWVSNHGGREVHLIRLLSTLGTWGREE